MSDTLTASRDTGIKLLQAGQLDDALGFLRHAVAAQPGDGWAHLYLGICQGRRGDLPAAVAALQEAARLLPHEPSARFNLGKALYHAGRLPEARVELEHACSLDPGSQAARDLLARTRAALPLSAPPLVAPPPAPVLAHAASPASGQPHPPAAQIAATPAASQSSATAPGAKPQAAGIPGRLRQFGSLGVFLAYFLGKMKFLLVGAKFILPVLKTGGSMLLSMWVYAQVWGVWFAAGFVLCILAHEMGHVFVAWRMGVPVSAPLFIPGFGALILQKRSAKSAWDEALIGIGGPVAGTLAGLVCYGAFLGTGHSLLLGLAYTSFFLNLFNLAPVYPLDGGWITGAISPRIWLVGIVLLAAGFLTGRLHNPMILLLVFMSAPRLWKGLRTGDYTAPGALAVLPHQRLLMGLSYVSLAGLLVWLMLHTHVPVS